MVHYSNQQSKILVALPLGMWVCHETLKKVSWNEHKRRGEIIVKKEFEIEDRPCIHGINRSLDYRRKLKKPEEEKETFPLKVEPVAARLF